jgi:hypothetical protein
MPATKAITPAHARILDDYNARTGAAITAGDRRTLRSIHDTLSWQLHRFEGSELARAHTLLARIEAGLRFVGGRHG